MRSIVTGALLLLVAFSAVSSNNRSKTEAGNAASCADCFDALIELSDFNPIIEIDDALPQRSSFIDGVRRLMRTPAQSAPALKTHRGLVQMPLLGNRGNIGVCGSHHYSPDQPIGVDSYASPAMACSFTSLLQNWKQRHCPDSNDGCRVAWGDISHRDRQLFNSHRSHTHGECVDIRPFRKGSFVDAGLIYGSRTCTKRVGKRCVARRTTYSPQYDAEMTRLFIQEARRAGATTILFDDPNMDSDRDPEHDNHLHVCFKDTPQTRQACQNFKPDLNTCPELR